MSMFQYGSSGLALYISCYNIHVLTVRLKIYHQPDPTGEPADEPERHGLLEASLFQTYQRVADPKKLKGSRQLSFGDLPQG